MPLLGNISAFQTSPRVETVTKWTPIFSLLCSRNRPSTQCVSQSPFFCGQQKSNNLCSTIKKCTRPEENVSPIFRIYKVLNRPFKPCLILASSCPFFPGSTSRFLAQYLHDEIQSRLRSLQGDLAEQ